MPRELYPEHKMMPIPDYLLLCQRCKMGLVYAPPNADPVCHKCGDGGRPGELFMRLSTIVATIKERFGVEAFVTPEGALGIPADKPLNVRKHRVNGRRQH